MVEYRDDQLGRWEGGEVHTGLGVLGSSVARRGGGGEGTGGGEGQVSGTRLIMARKIS